MPDVGLGGWIIEIAILALYVLIPASAIALGLRLAGFGRNQPQKRLRDRLSRGEITQAEFDIAVAALGR